MGERGAAGAVSQGGEAEVKAATPRRRPQDLLKLTAGPIHPFDEAHGVDTSGLVPAKHLRTGHPSDEHVTAYYGVAPSILRSLVARWRETAPEEPTSAYTFVDVGAGKGRALLVASELGFRRVVGVELNPAMASVARANVELWQAGHAGDPTALSISAIEVLEQDALELKLPPGPVLVFLFHPFEAPVLTEFVRRVGEQLAGRRPVLDLLYVNAECRKVLDEAPGFSRLFLGPVAMTPEDHVADLAAIAEQKEYGSTGDEECAIYRWVGGAKD